MQRVSAFLPSWDKRSSGTNNKTPSLFGWPNTKRSSASSNLSRLSTHTTAIGADRRVKREAFWPATLDLECDKAARILKSFCSDGYLAPLDNASETTTADGEPTTPVKINQKIPRRIIQNAAGIAVFTCMRSGLWMTGSGGSGILIARKSDGTWSPPSGIMLHTPTLSFIMGVDVYDCILVIDSLAALESITRSRVTLGEDVSLMPGPYVPIDSTEKDLRWSDLGNTVLTYLKARGQHQNVNINGCILTERANENERFYGSPVSQMDVLAGNVVRHVEETRPLFEVIKMAEGRTDFDLRVIDSLTSEPAPGDALIASPKSSPESPVSAFGVPDANDPDPFGVLALEMAGLEIREAGSHLRPSSNQFEFTPSPQSPFYSKFARQSIDTFASKSNRGSYMSQRTVRSQTTDTGTQTDQGKTPDTIPSPAQSESGNRHRSSHQRMKSAEDIDYTAIDMTSIQHLSTPPPEIRVPTANVNEAKPAERQEGTAAEPTPVEDMDDKAASRSSYKDTIPSPQEQDHASSSEELSDTADDEDEFDEEPVIFEVAAVQQRPTTQAVASRMIQAKGNVVTIPKRLPPPLPIRSPARASRNGKSEMGGEPSGLRSPLSQECSADGLSIADTEADATPTAEAARVRFPPALNGDASSPTAVPAAAVSVPAAQIASSTEEDEDNFEDAPTSPGDYKTHELSDSGSRTRHKKSFETNTTEDQWSIGDTAVTTPTSERISTPEASKEETPTRSPGPKTRASLDSSTLDTKHVTSDTRRSTISMA